MKAPDPRTADKSLGGLEIEVHSPTRSGEAASPAGGWGPPRPPVRTCRCRRRGSAPTLADDDDL